MQLTSTLCATAFVAVAACSTGRAQNTSTGVQFGPKVGLSLSVLDGQLNRTAQFKPGLVAGAFVRWRPSERVAIQPELVFSQQGSTNQLNFGGYPAENKIKLNYLNIPVLLKIYIGSVFNVQVGPQVGFLLSGRRVGQSSYYSNSGQSGYTTEDVDVKEFYKGDFALCGGIGVDLPNGLLGSVRINYGLSDIDNDASSVALRKAFSIGGLHNRTIEFSVGYAIGSSK